MNFVFSIKVSRENVPFIHFERTFSKESSRVDYKPRVSGPPPSENTLGEERVRPRSGGGGQSTQGSPTTPSSVPRL